MSGCVQSGASASAKTIFGITEVTEVKDILEQVLVLSREKKNTLLKEPSSLDHQAAGRQIGVCKWRGVGLTRSAPPRPLTGSISFR